ncbi:MAG: hypothetical protein ACFB4I_15665 [Cyanophyceae cyanobacterium]
MSLKLPLVDAGGETKDSLEQKFFRGSEILAEYLQEIEDKLINGEAFLTAVYNRITLGLFLKLSRSYRSFLLLELHSKDLKTIQFLSEQLCEAVVMLAFLAEEIDESSLCPYIATSLKQAYCLYALLEEKLLQSPKDAKLQSLKAKLQRFIERAQQQLREFTDTCKMTEGYADGCISMEIFDGSALTERAETVGIKALLDSSRKITLAVQPASLLDLHLFYLESSTTHFSYANHLKLIRDTSHACLHATKIFLDEVIACCYDHDVGLDLMQIDYDFNLFFEWFHNTYVIYQSI